MKDLKLALDLAPGQPFRIKEVLDGDILDSRNSFINEISQLIKKGKNIVSLCRGMAQRTKVALVFKLEWMSNLMMDAIRYQMTGDEKEIQIDTSAISYILRTKNRI